MARKIASILFLLTSVVIALGAFGHDSNAGRLAEEFAKSPALDAGTVSVVIAVWHFCSGCMFVLGTICAWSWWRIRAGARDPEIVRVLGIDVSKIWLVVFGIGTGIAGLSGILSAPLQSVTPEMGVSLLADAFVVTVVGGMGSLTGAVVAGVLVGVVVSLTSLVSPEAGRVSIFVLMAVVLLVRPQGLFGRTGALG